MICERCKYYSELKQPRVQRHREGFVYTVRGYCFRGPDRAGYNMGAAVLSSQAYCVGFEREDGKNDTAGN